MGRGTDSLRIALTHVTAWPEVRRGGERYLHELAAALVDRGHDVRIVTTAAEKHRDRVLGVPVSYLPRRTVLRRGFRSLAPEAAFGLQALAHLLPSRLDVWHALGTADAAAAAFFRDVGRWQAVYTSLGFPKRASRDRRPDRGLHDIVVRRVDHYVCLSKETGSHLRTDYGRDPVVLGGGVDTRRFRPADLRAAVPTVLFSGALDEKRKNLALVLAAVARLKPRIPALELWLSGPGDATSLVAAAPEPARSAVRMHGIGTPDSLADLYGRAWVTALPAQDEAFGLVLVESLACGTPIVALRGGGPGELVRPGAGALADPNEESLSEAIGEALELGADPHTKAVCRDAAMAYDWRATVAPRLEDLYRGRQLRTRHPETAGTIPSQSERGNRANVESDGG